MTILVIIAGAVFKCVIIFVCGNMVKVVGSDTGLGPCSLGEGAVVGACELDNELWYL
jgi:hypothetical protein